MDVDAVLFDCDGVPVYGEATTNGVLRDMPEELGWMLTPEECACAHRCARSPRTTAAACAASRAPAAAASSLTPPLAR